MVDTPGFDIRPYFEEGSKFIEDAVRHGTRVLVHCVAGVSRSVAVVLAWMMSRRQIRLRDALKAVRRGYIGCVDQLACLLTLLHGQVQKARPIIHPNEGFLFALATYELELFKCSSVAETADKRWNFYKVELRVLCTRYTRCDGVLCDGSPVERDERQGSQVSPTAFGLLCGPVAQLDELQQCCLFDHGGCFTSQLKYCATISNEDSWPHHTPPATPGRMQSAAAQMSCRCRLAYHGCPR